MARKKKNPSPLVTGALVVGGVLALAAGVKAYEDISKARQKKRALDKKKEASPFSGVYAENATLGASDQLVSEVALPVVYTKENTPRLQMRRPDTGEIIDIWATEDEYPVVVADVLALLVTDLTADAAYKAWMMMQHLVANKGYDLEAPAMRDQAVQETLAVIASKVDWTQGLAPYTVDSVPWRVWTGVDLIGTTAYQSFWNRQSLQVGDVASAGTENGQRWRVVYTGMNQLNMPQYMAQIFVVDPEGEQIKGFGPPGDWVDVQVFVELDDAVGSAMAAAAAEAAAAA